MKRYFIIFAFFFQCVFGFAQNSNSILDSNNDSIDGISQFVSNSQNSWEGAGVSPVGQFRVLNILINIIYDVTPNLEPYESLTDPWPRAIQAGIKTTIPDWVPDSSLFDIHFNQSENINGTFTRKFHESSFGALHMVGDFVVINVPQSYVIAGNPTPLPNGQFEISTLISRSIEYLNTYSVGGLQTIFGHNLISDYEFNNTDTVYFCSIATRNTFSSDLGNYGNFNANNGTAGVINDVLLFSDGNYYPIRITLLQCVGPSRHLVQNPLAAIYHEFGHMLFGDNRMHSGGGNGWSHNTGRTFLPRMGGYGLMGMAGTGMVSANGFDRWWLQWKSPEFNSTNSYIAANDQPSDISITDGTKNFILRDFVTTGDAIRIKLPYVDEGAKNQYIWLENHKIGANNKLDFFTYSNTTQCRPFGESGIYAFYQIGKDLLSGNNIRPSGESDHLRLISAEGNFNYKKMSDVALSCFGDMTVNGHGRQLEANPFMGFNDAMIQFYHETASTLKIESPYVFLLDAKDKFFNGQWVRNDSMPYLMDERDAFRGISIFNLSSNPAAVNTTTFYNTNDVNGNISPNSSFGLINNDSIYITGLNITMKQLLNGDYKVSIDWGHNRLDNNVAWAGKIALPEALYVYDDDTLLLKQNNSPCQILRDPITHQFAPFTAFDCRPNSQLTLSNTSHMIASEKSKIYVQSGSVLTLQNSAKLIVKSGSELIIEDCGNLVIRDNAQLIIESEGFITIKSGANVFMDGQSNLILQNGFLIGEFGIQINTNNALTLLGVPPVKQITTNTTWTEKSYKFFDDLYIAPGATLTLSGCELKFFRTAKAKVARGAKLEMSNNCNLTTTCNSELWNGVEVWGNPSVSQTPATNQGHLVMSNSKIEFARTGVLLDKPMYPTENSGTPGVPSGNGGGIIQAVNSSFTNNYIGVSFSPYIFKVGDVLVNNESYFNNCLFTANGQYPDLSAGIDCHTNLNGVTGIDFLKCTFSISDGVINKAGIRSHNAKFTVNGIISNHKYQRSIFENLKHGIYATASLSSRNYTVRNTVFKNCTKGIFASGVNNMSITNNFFEQPLQNVFPTYNRVGIYLEYCTGYSIQYDTIKSISDRDRSEVGMYIKNSGPHDNLIYNNGIIDMNEAIIVEGENRNGEAEGLCIKCNVFMFNKNDIRILPGTNITEFNRGIKRYQGSPANDPKAPAGNIFTNYPPDDFFNIDNEQCRPIEYFHHPQMQGLAIVRPPDEKVRIFEKTVTLTLNPLHQFDRPTACPPIPNHVDSKEELISGVLLLDDAISETKSELELLTDDGDTPLTLNNINSSFPFEALWLHDELLGASPYLSDTVLVKAAEKEDVLNSALIRDVMVANPHSAKSNKVIETLELRSESLPESIWAEINAGRNQISARQALEISISDLSTEKAIYRNMLLQAYQEDHKNDSLRWLMNQIPDALSSYKSAWTWFDEGNTAHGLIEIQNVDLTTIPENHRSYHNGYIQVAEIIKLLATDTSYVLLNDSTALNTLLTLAVNDNPSGISARNLLTAYRLMDFEAIIQIPATSLKSVGVTFDNSKKAIADITGILVFPNPASDYTIVSYALEESGMVELLSQDGRIIRSEYLKPGINQHLLRTGGLPSGVYTIKLSGGKKNLTSRLVIK